MNLYLKMVMIVLGIALIGCNGKKNGGQQAEVDIPKGDLIKGATEVKKVGTEYYGVGYFVGKPIKSSSKGLIFNTNEVEVNLGAFGGDFIGNTASASIEDDGLAGEFGKLDRNTLYVFKFEYPHPLNPEIESTHYHIRSWEPLDPNISFTHKGVDSRLEKSGSYAKGQRQGKVVLVERWGYWDIDCTIQVLMGGIRRGAENSITMNTYSEESCAFAEQALKAGAYVSFEYSQDYIEVWDGNSHILHTIQLIDSASSESEANSEGD